MNTSLLPTKVVIVSDCSDVAFIEMRASISDAFFKALPDTTLSPQIEPLVESVPYSLTNASFLTRLVAETATENTLIMVIANFISERTERIIGKTKKKNIFFEGTNTGVFGWLKEDYGIQECYELHDPGFLPFGGKYVHSPAVGKALAGVLINELGNVFPIEQVRSHLPRTSEIVHIDNFGNAKIFLKSIDFCEGEKVVIGFEGLSIDPIEATVGARMMSFPNGSWVLYPGSSFGLYELGQVRTKGLLNLPVEVGMQVKINRFEKNGKGD